MFETSLAERKLVLFESYISKSEKSCVRSDDPTQRYVFDLIFHRSGVVLRNDVGALSATEYNPVARGNLISRFSLKTKKRGPYHFYPEYPTSKLEIYPDVVGTAEN